MDNSQDPQEERLQRKENSEEAEKEEDYGNALSRKEATEELLGCVVHSEEEAYKLYCDYGHRIGFSVRKGKQSYFIGTKNIRTKDYYCSKEGLKYDEPVTEANFNRPDTRTNCKAMIRFRVDEKGQWTVIRFVPIHNHQLAKPGERHMLRSAKSLAVGKSGVIDPAASVESHQMNGFSDMTEGDIAEPPGYTIRDCYNHVNMQGITMIEAGDCQSLVSYFKRRTNEEGMFYWDVQVDQESRMINFFFRDGKSRSDYDCFGDAVIFDTTYRTTKYSLICALFIGVNHHWHNVVFGCAFLLNDSTASYVWLFRSFLESMGGQSPKSIFTDQDEAIMQAIEQVFPNTQHCFSYWHILKNAQYHLQYHFGTVNTFQAFQNIFMKCMQGSDSEKELEESRKIFWDSLETGEKALEVFFEMRSLFTQTASKRVNRRKKSSKGPRFKKTRQAQSRMKKSADWNRCKRQFEVGYMVYLKLQLYRASAFGLKPALKLTSRFLGPFRVLQKVSKVAYKLLLPEGVGFHPVFHVSQLKRHCGPNAVPSADLPLVSKEGKVRVEPLTVLETRALPRCDILVTQWLIQWINLPPEDTTWEDADGIKSTFPEFYSQTVKYWFLEKNT